MLAEQDEAVVVTERGRTSGAELLRAVRDVGYEARVIPIQRATLVVRDMDCGGCPERVRQALRRVAGVRTVAVERRGVARVDYDRTQTNEQCLVRAVARVGFTATVPTRRP
jgi:copper chaperone CopZ